MNRESAVLARYLDEVSAHLGSSKGKRDVIRELESAILDRAEEIGKGEVSDDAVREALTTMGEPAEVALAYAGERYLISPRMYRPFLIYTGILFVIHLVMIVVASVTDGLEVLSLNVLRVPHPHSLLNLAAVAVQALLMDIGLMVVIFTGVSRTQRTVRLPRLAFRVEAGFRSSITRAILALLVMVILNLLRDQIFIVVLEDRVHLIFTQSFEAVLPFLNVFLALIIAKESAYAFLGEKRGMVAVDGALAALGVALMIWFLTRNAFISFPTKVNEITGVIPSLNQLVHKTVQLILIAFAVGFAIQAVKRFIRLRQMWT
jgi:hypothetical protein